MMNTNKKGFTLIELMIVVAIIAIIAAVGVPIFLRAKISANEGATIANLKNITSSQALFQTSAIIDENANGAGEYGTLGELTGAYIRGGLVGQNPPSLSAGLRPNTALVAGSGCSKSGYFIQVFLPTPASDNATFDDIDAAIADPNATSAHFRIYAWPISANSTGVRAFCANETNDILATANLVATANTFYNGIAANPTSDAASDQADDVDFAGVFLISSGGVSVAQDGNIYVSAGN